MITDREIWGAADAMIRRCGTDTVGLAAMRAETFLELGDREAVLTWRRVATAIEKWQPDKPALGERVQ
jgi:hypothetical protein